MSTPGRKKRGYVLLPALLVFTVAGLYAVVLARYGLLEMTAVRREWLEACTEQIVQSARAWATINADQLDGPRELPIGELLPAGASGRVVVEPGADQAGSPILVCHVTVEVGSRRVNLSVESPFAPAAERTAPASRHANAP